MAVGIIPASYGNPFNYGFTIRVLSYGLVLDSKMFDVRDYSLVPRGKASSEGMSSLVPRWPGNESSSEGMSSLVPRMAWE